MSRSYWLIESKKIECFGPNNDEKSNPAKADIEIVELWGVKYTIICNSCTSRLEDKKYCCNITGRRKKCIIDKMSDLELKKKFFPELNLNYLKPNE